MSLQQASVLWYSHPALRPPSCSLAYSVPDSWWRCAGARGAMGSRWSLLGSFTNREEPIRIWLVGRLWEVVAQGAVVENSVSRENSKISNHWLWKYTRNTSFVGIREATLDFLVLYKNLALSKCYIILHTRLQLMWIELVLGNLLWPCSPIETSDTGIHWSRKVSYLKSPVSNWSGEKQRRWRDTTNRVLGKV